MSELKNVPEEFLVKVKKILNHKESLERIIKDGSGSGHEQKELENVTMKLTKLLLEYNLEMSHVSAYQEKGKTPPLQETEVSLEGKQTRHEAGWVEKLYSVIAQSNMCYALHRKGRNGKDDMGHMLLFGNAMNMELVTYFVDQLVERIREMCGAAFKKYMGHEKRNTFRRGFFRGAVDGLRIQLSNQLQLEAGPNTEMGLMIINNNKAVQLFAHQRYKIVFKQSQGLSGKSGYDQGLEKGKSISMNKGLPSNTGGPKRLGY